MDEREARGARSLIARHATKRFGEPSEGQRAALDAIADMDRLTRLDDRIPDATNWDDLLATP
jgi:hypothetical protein